MAEPSPSRYDPLLPQPHNQPIIGIPIQDPAAAAAAAVIILPYRRLRRRRCRCLPSLLSSSSLLTLSFSLLLLALALFLLFPSDPTVSIARLRLRRVRISALPNPKLSLSLSLKVKIQNRDFFSLDYRSIVVSIGYRGKKLGFVSSEGGRIRARGVSYVDAEMLLDGVGLVGDLFYLVEDLARGSVPFETVTEVDGVLHVPFLDIPVDGRISCSVNVNPDTQKVVRQDCFPE